MKLLVVDDDPDLLALVAFALTNAGYSVVKASDTPEALRRSHVRRFHDWLVAEVAGMKPA